MLSNTGPVAKLYLSIIDDVIESMRELYLDEGLEDRVLDDLRRIWEAKMMQSKAMEDFRKNNINSSNFVLQLPDSYGQIGRAHKATVVIPAGQSIHGFPNNSETLATFSLPAGLAYPVQIPAGVTLQTASGQLYKVNVPVVVTQAPMGQKPLSLQIQRAPAPQSTAAPPDTKLPQQVEPPPAPAPSVSQSPQADLPPSPESSPVQQPQVPTADATQLPVVPSPPAQENEPSAQPEPVNYSMTSSPCSQLLEEALAQTTQLKSRDIDDILKQVIEEEREKAERRRNLPPARTQDQTEAVLAGLGLDYSYSELSDIVQLDGPPDNSDAEEEGGAPLEENDFLGIINAEAIKALQEGGGSSDGNSLSSSSDSEGADKLSAEDEDPLNSGDDVIEQDIPDLFDTDNVIVCQYDKIHRSKNRWKFHLKDGVMCYAGRDYVFSKAVGEAEW
ncbi:TFIIA-alpha and beta-like factor [Pleuronectes platessa]|uniref:TFIIA-alpha and beta-like factor n=1 Tax=Pleuronectes platessa TaxID=8262 RepID=UPI00232A0A3A|nr:TFIIA-alpha and beta-like factor [Pleuronectes platessa]